MSEDSVPDYADGSGLLAGAPARTVYSATMRVVVAGAGVVGRSIARELVAGGHHVTLIDKRSSVFSADPVDGADQQVGDACELSVLERLDVQAADVVVVAAALAVVVAHMEATALLPCAAAMVAPLVATLPEVEATVVVTVAVVVPAAATTLTEQRTARSNFNTALASKPSLANTMR